MTTPLFCRETLAHARANPFWGAAFLLTLLIPFMIIYARVGFEICCGLIGLMFLWHSFRTRSWDWVRDPITVVALVLWGWMVLVVMPLAMSPSAKWLDAIAWIRFPLMFCALRYWILAVPAARTTLAAMLAAMLALIVVDTLWQFLTGVSLTGNPRTPEGRMTGPFESPKVGAFIGKMALASMGVCIIAALTNMSRRWVILCLLLWAFVVLTVLLSGERSAFLMVSVATAVIAALMMLRVKRLRAPCIAGAIVVMIGLLVLHQTSPWIRLRAYYGFQTMVNYSQSDYGVLAISAYEMGKEHWQHGVGIRGYRAVSPDLHYVWGTFRGFHPHNAFLEMFAEAGLIGLLLMITLVGTMARNAIAQFRRARGREALLPAMAIGVLVQHFFPLVGMQSFFSNWAAVIVWFCLALAFAGIPVREVGDA
jgi:O-antigen ligase